MSTRWNLSHLWPARALQPLAGTNYSREDQICKNSRDDVRRGGARCGSSTSILCHEFNPICTRKIKIHNASRTVLLSAFCFLLSARFLLSALCFLGSPIKLNCNFTDRKFYVYVQIFGGISTFHPIRHRRVCASVINNQRALRELHR